MTDPVEVWQRLMSPAGDALREAAAVCDARDVAAVARLRRDYDAELVTAALDLAAARRKAAGKFPARADQLVADAQGVEQATSRAVGRHKVSPFVSAVGEGDPVFDLCCGIGGDAMTLTEAGLPVIGVDRDPVRAWMCGLNAGCETRVADVAEVPVDGAWCHLDPSRRTQGRRLWRLQDLVPGPDVIRDIITRARGGAVKLAPGVDQAELDNVDLRGDIEYISEAGRLVQAVLWTGELARGERLATLVSSCLRDRVSRRTCFGVASDANAETSSAANGHRRRGMSPHVMPGKGATASTVHTLRASLDVMGDEHALPLAEPRRYLFAVDPAAERAGLLGVLSRRLDAPAIHPKLGLLTADRAVADAWVTTFELLERMPWRERRVAAWLAEHDAGVVEVKTRGKAVNPDEVQPRLNGLGDTPYTLFVLRFGRRVEALVTRRVAG